jgi:hypothetical protein
MSRLFISIAICFPAFFCVNGHAAEFAPSAALTTGYTAALLRGAERACAESERGTKLAANMLQTGCVATQMNAGIEHSEIHAHCFGASNRIAFEEFAEVICGKFEI